RNAVAGGIKGAQLDLRFVVAAVGGFAQDGDCLRTALRQPTSVDVAFRQAYGFVGDFCRLLPLSAHTRRRLGLCFRRLLAGIFRGRRLFGSGLLAVRRFCLGLRFGRWIHLPSPWFLGLWLCLLLARGLS